MMLKVTRSEPVEYHSTSMEEIHLSGFDYIYLQ